MGRHSRPDYDTEYASAGERELPPRRRFDDILYDDDTTQTDFVPERRSPSPREDRVRQPSIALPIQAPTDIFNDDDGDLDLPSFDNVTYSHDSTPHRPPQRDKRETRHKVHSRTPSPKKKAPQRESTSHHYDETLQVAQPDKRKAPQETKNAKAGSLAENLVFLICVCFLILGIVLSWHNWGWIYAVTIACVSFGILGVYYLAYKKSL